MAFYQIKLTPTGKYFFGGEKHNSLLETNYFVRSNYFPQQTTLLGFIRYLLLLKNGLIGSARIKTEGEQHIGNQSFNFNNPALTFGKIKSISPLYFLKNEEVYIIPPFDYEFDLQQEGVNFFLRKGDKIYTSKDQFPSTKLVNLSGMNPTPLFENEPGKSVMFPISQTGNEKAEKGESNEDSFYKQTFMKMEYGWSFAIQAEIEDDLNDTLYYLPLGGEQCIFKIEIICQKDRVSLEPKLVHYKRKLPLLYLFSDCFAESRLMDLTCFAVNKVISFRNFRTTVNTLNYSAFGVKPNGLNRSDRYNLLSRGSVLYFLDSAFRNKAAILLEKDHCKKIGFNHYQKIN
ncbi:MAG: hypothetical protein NTU44_00160 [Bacteroidetes bacterium]|nr:hypothetical protein [Bacteroidota bacterium]